MGRHHDQTAAQVTRRALFAAAAALPLRAAAVPNSVLVHEHILVNFLGVEDIPLDDVIRIARPKLEALKPLGCVRLHECTPNYLGRMPSLLRRLSEATGIDIWTNTGLYGAANHKYLPPYAHTETAEQLARRWIREAQLGVDGLHPRFIKSGVNKGPLDPLDRKLVQAAALASRETGLPAAIHTGDGKAALEEAEIFTAARAPLSQLIWVHAQNEKDHAIHEQLARAGVWVEFDGINARSAAWHEECLRFMASRQLLNHTLISQDSGWYRPGEPNGGQYNGYTYLYTDFLPKLDGAWIRPLLVDNPRAAFPAGARP